jgi:hypothetical protein
VKHKQGGYVTFQELIVLLASSQAGDRFGMDGQLCQASGNENFFMLSG